LSASEFADEIARFYNLPRASLPQMLAATSLAGRISRRFLRETAVFPCKAEGDDSNTLIVSDPTDETAIHAAELVLGKPIELAVASFEDIATALSERLGEEEPTPPGEVEGPVSQRDDDIESLRDLASGAPVVRAVNDLLEKAVESRATDIHVEPFDNGLFIRMRIDGLLRGVPTPADVLPQAVTSRIKILAGLNISEDG